MAERRRYSEQQHQQMRAMRAAGDKLLTIAHRFGCSVSVAQWVVRRVPRGPWKRKDGTMRGNAPEPRV